LPRPKAWKLDQIFKWLDENPIKSPADMVFLTNTVNTKKLQSTEAFDASKAEKELLERSWTGKKPYLRLIHCLVEDDDIKYEFLHRHDIECVENLRRGIDTLKAEKRRLVIEISANKKCKTMVDLIMEQVDEIKNDTREKEAKLQQLLGAALLQQQLPGIEDQGTPQRNNWTPESASMTLANL
jgi:hypothetical protein